MKNVKITVKMSELLENVYDSNSEIEVDINYCQKF